MSSLNAGVPEACDDRAKQSYTGPVRPGQCGAPVVPAVLPAPALVVRTARNRQPHRWRSPSLRSSPAAPPLFHVHPLALGGSPAAARTPSPRVALFGHRCVVHRCLPTRQAPPQCSVRAASGAADGRAHAGADDGYDSDAAVADVAASNAMLRTRPGAPHLPQAPSRVRHGGDRLPMGTRQRRAHR